MIPIYIWTLKQKRWTIFWWSACLIALIATLMSVYPSIRDQADQLNKTLEQLPQALRSLKSNTSDDLLSPIGYLNSQLYYATLPLLLAILSISLGAKLLGDDEQSKTLELLLARPVSRGRIVAAKALAGLTIMLAVNLASTVATVIFAHIVGLEVSAMHITVTSFYSMLLATTFGAVAFACTAATQAGKRLSIGAATIFGIGGYLLQSLAGLSDFIATPAKLFPYHYYEPYQILQGHTDGALLAYLFTALIGCAVVSWAAFSHRDIE